MYLYYLLGWKLTSKSYGRWQKGEDEKKLQAEVQVRKEEMHMQEHTANFSIKTFKCCVYILWTF